MYICTCEQERYGSMLRHLWKYQDISDPLTIFYKWQLQNILQVFGSILQFPGSGFTKRCTALHSPNSFQFTISHNFIRSMVTFRRLVWRVLIHALGIPSTG